MSDPEFGLITIGNAMVDILARTDDNYLAAQKEAHGMEKGSMNLIQEDRAEQLYKDMIDATEMSGGSAGNTMACFSSFGGKGGYIGKVANDELGQTFINSLRDIGVDYKVEPLIDGASTGRCMILVTPDGERTMNTYLGAANELTPNDINPDYIAKAQVVYLEGYLYDPKQAMEAFVKASRAAHEGNRRVSLTLSDKFCVDRHRQSFLDLVSYHVDILFANEDELKALYEVDDLEAALDKVKNDCAISATTRSEKGSIIINSGKRTDIDAVPVKELVDTTGAGDAYAAGFLYAFTEGMNMKECGYYGSLAASHIIEQMGPRPSVRLSELAEKAKAA
ncbi:MAG: adenosine kinase [Pseudomonadota bacterium]